MRKNQGFTLIEVIIVVIVIVIIGALGVVGYNTWKNNGATQANDTTKTTAVKVPDVIKSTSDLDTASKALDSASLNTATTDSQQLTSKSSGF